MNFTPSAALSLLQRVVEPSVGVPGGFLDARAALGTGDFRAATERCAISAEAHTAVLRLTGAFNGATTTPTPLEPIARTVVNSIFMYANTRDSLGKLELDEALCPSAHNYADRCVWPTNGCRGREDQGRKDRSTAFAAWTKRQAFHVDAISPGPAFFNAAATWPELAPSLAESGLAW